MKIESNKKVNFTSTDLTKEKLSELRHIFPEVFSEGKIDWEKFRTVLGGSVDNRVEKFNFTWAGKSNAIKNVLAPSKLTLNPQPEQSIKWDESENLFIEGDNLEVLKLLQKAYFEKVKMIYIDPPYNTGHDFVYNDDFSSPLDNYLKQTGQKSEGGDSNTTNKETNGRYHSDWLSMMYPRLKLAWNLLREDGVIFVSIDDNEVHHLRMIFDEVFGEENFIGQFNWVKTETPSNLSESIKNTIEYIICYQKDATKKVSFFGVEKEAVSSNPLLNQSNRVSCLEFSNLTTETGIPDGVLKKGTYGTSKYVIELLEDIEIKNGIFLSPVKLKGKFRWTQTYLNEQIKNGVKISIRTKQLVPSYEKSNYGKEIPSNLINYEVSVGTNEQASSELEEVMGGKYFSYPKPISLIKYLARMVTVEGDIILDFFAGSGTTAHALLNENRKWICIQLPEVLSEGSGKNDQEKQIIKNGISFLESLNLPKNIAELCKERIRRVINGYGGRVQSIDAGFKVFKLSESNYLENNFVVDVEKSQEENQKAFIDYLNKAKQNQLFDKDNDASIVYENIVKEGLSLNSKVETVAIGKNKIYKVADGEQQLLICLESKLTSETVRELTDKTHKDKIFICLESSLDDTSSANLSLNVDLKTI